MAKALTSRRNSQGQAVIGAFALMIILTVALIYLFNIGTAYSEKVKLTDAADAAVYAQAATTAKRLNFAAYTNRAMAVNHLAVGHTISYLSWIRYLNNAWTNNPNFFIEFDNPGFITQLICNGLANAGLPQLPGCIAHPTAYLNYLGIFAMQQVFTTGIGGIVAPSFNNHEPDVIAALGDMALNNPNIFAAQTDAFAQALAVNRVITHDVVSTYVQDANNPIRINGCALNDPLCVNRNNDVQDAINLANQLGQNNLVLALNDLLPAPGNDPFAGNITLNEQAILGFVEGGPGAVAAINGLFGATFLSSPSFPWINNRDWQAANPPNPCGAPIPDPSGCRDKVGGTVLDPITQQWAANDSATNFNDGSVAIGAASTVADIPGYVPFPGGFSLPDAAGGGPGPQNDAITVQILLSQPLPFNDWNNNELNKGRRKLALHVIDENNPLQESNVFNTGAKILTAYAQAEVYYQRPVANNGGPEWFALFAPPITTEFANLYNPFWQARLVDTVGIDF